MDEDGSKLCYKTVTEPDNKSNEAAEDLKFNLFNDLFKIATTYFDNS